MGWNSKKNLRAKRAQRWTKEGKGFSSSFIPNAVPGPTLKHNRDIKIRRRRRQRGCQKSNRFNNQHNNFARASRFFVHFFAVTARLRRENAWFHVLQRKYTSNDEISSLYLNLDMVLRNSTLGGFDKVSDLSNRDEDWKNANSLFQRRLRCRRRLRILRSLLIWCWKGNSSVLVHIRLVLLWETARLRVYESVWKKCWDVLFSVNVSDPVIYALWNTHWAEICR